MLEDIFETGKCLFLWVYLVTEQTTCPRQKTTKDVAGFLKPPKGRLGNIFPGACATWLGKCVVDWWLIGWLAWGGHHTCCKKCIILLASVHDTPPVACFIRIPFVLYGKPRGVWISVRQGNQAARQKVSQLHANEVVDAAMQLHTKLLVYSWDALIRGNMVDGAFRVEVMSGWMWCMSVLALPKPHEWHHCCQRNFNLKVSLFF